MVKILVKCPKCGEVYTCTAHQIIRQIYCECGYQLSLNDAYNPLENEICIISKQIKSELK